MSKESIEQKIEQLCMPLAVSRNLEIVQVQYRREHVGWTLRIFIDHPNGINVTDCENFSRELSHLLDLEDLIPSNYNLEVSSPGLDRPLIKPDDFDRFAGSEITLKTRNSVEGKNHFRGKLDGFQNNMIVLHAEGKRYEFEWSSLEKANLVPALEAKTSQQKSQNN